MTLIDTHCHLDDRQFDGDRQEVLARAAEAGVRVVLSPGVDLESSKLALELADRFEMVFAAVGIHPNSSRIWDAKSLDTLRKLAEHPKVVAIGEIGLDYYRDKAPREVQMNVFLSQLNLAAELELPVIVHNRQAGRDIMQILTSWHADLETDQKKLSEHPGVLHSYSEDQTLAKEVMASHFFLGFTGPVTFRNAPDLQAVASKIPANKLLVETDSPYLSPHPYRGRRNEPGRVKLIAEKLAELRKTTFDTLAEITTTNAERLFGFGAI